MKKSCQNQSKENFVNIQPNKWSLFRHLRERECEDKKHMEIRKKDIELDEF